MSTRSRAACGGPPAQPRQEAPADLFERLFITTTSLIQQPIGRVRIDRRLATSYNLGGMIRLTAGEFDSQRLELRHSMALANDWYLKVVVAETSMTEFSHSRTDAVEYSRPCPPTGGRDCLPLEVLPLPRRDWEGRGGLVRLDKYFAEDSVLTLEAASSSFEAGAAFFTSSGRYQVIDDRRSWARIAFRSKHWRAQGIYDQGELSTISLAAGTYGFVENRRSHLEVEGNTRFSDGKGFLIGGLRSSRLARWAPRRPEK